MALNYNKIYIYNDEYNGNYYYDKICSQNVDVTMKRFIIVVAIACLSYVAALIGPIHAFIAYNTRSTLLNLRLPFIEKDSHLEFALNLLLQTWCGLIGVCAIIGTEVVYNFYIETVRFTTKLIRMDIDKLSRDLEARVLTKAQVKFNLFLIFEKIHHTDRY